MRILVVGANGKTGRHVIAALQARNETIEIRGFCRGPVAIAGVEGMQGDLEVPDDRARAVAGMDVVIYYGPPAQPRETAMGTGMIDAAVAAGVKRFVYISVIHPQIDDLINHVAKLHVEAHLIDTDLDWTILRPQHYMQNIDVPAALAAGAVVLPFPVDKPLAHVDMFDLAEAAAKVAAEPGHSYASYDISGAFADDLSTDQICAVIEQVTQRKLASREVSPAQFVAAIARTDQPTSYMVETAYRVCGYYARRGIKGNPNVFTWLCGRPPTSFAEYVARSVSADRD